MEMGTLDGMIGCVAAGVGFAILPRAVVGDATKAGRVHLYDLPSDLARSATVFVQRRDTFVTAALRCFADCATANIAGTDARSKPVPSRNDQLD
jgi:LysR family transcriptional regulator, cell division regulator